MCWPFTAGSFSVKESREQSLQVAPSSKRGCLGRQLCANPPTRAFPLILLFSRSLSFSFFFSSPLAQFVVFSLFLQEVTRLPRVLGFSLLSPGVFLSSSLR